MFRHSYAGLSERNKTNFAHILEFVRSFSRAVVVSKDGNPVLDSRGNPVTKPRVLIPAPKCNTLVVIYLFLIYLESFL